MKNIILLVVLIICQNALLSQNGQEIFKDSSNFYDIRKAYLEINKLEKQEFNNNKIPTDGIEEKFKRWEYIMEPRVYPSGKFPKPTILLDELNKFNEKNYFVFDTLIKSNWIPLESPAGFPDQGYSGRLNCIAFNPNDTNIIFVGTPSGGLWKSSDAGNSWEPMTDNIPSLGVSEIVIDPTNPEIMYIATGDKDGAAFISNPYSYGILKSTDGGDTWDTTGLHHIFSDQMTIQRLIMNPNQTNILMAAISGTNGANRGVWRTSDSGKNWVNVSGGAKYDIEFNPDDPEIVYYSGWKNLGKSTDAGLTWKSIKSDTLPFNVTSYARIAVSKADPHSVYAQFLNPNTGMTYGLYKSNDDGLTWVTKNRVEINTQGGYDWVLTVSPFDTNIIFSGGQILFGSDNGGVTLMNFQSGHVDHHGLDYRPGTNELFNCNDGGLYKSYNDGATWENLNKGFQTFQFYRLGCSASDESKIITGAQDNGVQYHDFLSWHEIGILADGMECIVDYSDVGINYVSYQYGYMLRIDSYYNEISPPNSSDPKNYAWITPYIIHPKTPSILFAAGKDIYKTTNRGNFWTKYSDQLTAKDNVGGGMIRTLAISESVPDSVLYAASYVVVYKTTDGGNSWLDVTSNLPTSAGCFDCTAISYIAVHPSNPDIAWVTMSGYSNENKVFETTDGGDSWFNISENLPNAPVNCIVYQKLSKDVLYIGTDLGVFFKDSTDKNWKPFMEGLPYVPVMELEIHYASGKLRAATFGRGLWESNLYGVVSSVADYENNGDNWLKPNPASSYLELPDKFSGKKHPITIFSLSGNIIYSGNSGRKIDVSFLNDGMYFLKINTQTYKFIVMK